MPTVLTSTPNAPAIRFRKADLPLIDASIESPNRVSAKYSWGRKLNAISANRGAARIKMTRLKSPPITLDTAAMPRARPASPRCALGYPSQEVAPAGGAPGVLINMVGIGPPTVPAQSSAALLETASMGTRPVGTG